MEEIREKYFTREQGIRNLILLGITIALVGWTYVSIALLGGNWIFINVSTSENVSISDTLLGLSFLGAILGAEAALAILVYWNATTWMRPCLAKSMLNFFGMIPFINKLVSEESRNSWAASIVKKNSPQYETIRTYYYYGGWSWGYSDDDGSHSLLLAIPLGILSAVLRGSVKCIGYLIAAVGIPVFTPMIGAILAMWGIQIVSEKSVVLTAVVGILAIVITILAYIVHPILSLKRKNNEIGLLSER